MSQNSAIGWCHHTVNTVWGCVEVSEACDFCYAREMDRRRGPMFDHGNLHWGKDAPRWIRTETAQQLGHADTSMLFKNYRLCVSEVDAAAYWAIPTPEASKEGA